MGRNERKMQRKKETIWKVDLKEKKVVMQDQMPVEMVVKNKKRNRMLMVMVSNRVLLKLLYLQHRVLREQVILKRQLEVPKR